MKRNYLSGALLTVLAFAAVAIGKEPLHQRIDKIIESASIGGTARVAGDADFVRRVFLDLTGRIPSAAEARAFLDSKKKGKRAQLIDALLKSPLFSIHMAQTFDIMLMERRGNKHVSAAQWETYLRASFDSNKPYNLLAAEILGADGVDPKKRASARFYLDRAGEVNRLTRDVGRMFFGIDLQCAQCHNHPLIDDYLQSDYYGIYSFLSRSYMFKSKKLKKTVLAERPSGGVNFKSVFTKLQGEANPRLPGDLEISEPKIDPAKQYLVKPAKNVRPVPRYSRRAQLAKLVSKGTNHAFNRNISNRLWALVMGRGLVEPVDLHHSLNPSSHPQLTKILADEFAAMKYDVRAFLRELLLSRSYQRTIEMPSNLSARAKIAVQQLPQLKALHAQQSKVSEKDLKAFNAADEIHSSSVKELVPLLVSKRKAVAAIAAAKKAYAAAAKAAGSLEQTLVRRQTVAKLLGESAAKLAAAGAVQPKDKQLAQVVATVKAQAAAAAKSATALAKTAGPKIAAKKAAAARQKSANNSNVQVDTKLASMRSKIAAQYITVNAARKQWQRTNALATFAESRVDASDALAEFARLDGIKRKADQAVAAQLTKVQPVAATVNRLTTQLKQQKSTRDTATKRGRQLSLTTKKLTSDLATKQKVLPLLSDSAAKASAAAKLVPQDAKLQTVAKALRQQSASAAANIKALQTQLTKANKELLQAKSVARSAKLELAKANKQLKPQSDQLLKLRSSLASLQRKASDTQAAWDKHYMEMTDTWSQRFAVAPLSPLSPEQLAWSIMRATGLEARQRTAAVAVVNKKNPPKKSKITPSERSRQVEAQVFAKLKGNVGEFVKLFSPGSGQPQNQFFATPDQALFVANGTRMRGWLSPGTGGLVGQLAKIKDDKKLCEEMYLAVLSRRPTVQEFADIRGYLTKDPKKRAPVIQEIVWSLVASAEFRFKH